MQTGERSSGKAYSFNYSILEERTGLHHSRDEARDEDGHIRGNYEVSLSSSSFYMLSCIVPCILCPCLPKRIESGSMTGGGRGQVVMSAWLAGSGVESSVSEMSRR